MPESEPKVAQSATLIVFGEDLEPSRVSQALELTPSQTWRKGEQRSYVDSDGKKRFFDSNHEAGVWKLWLDEGRLNDELCDQLEHWARVLRPKVAVLQDLRGQGAVLELNCCVFTSTTALVEINHKLFVELSNLGVDLNIAFFAHEDRDEGPNTP